MKMLILLSLFTSVAMSCGDANYTYRCYGAGANDWSHTQRCMKKLGIPEGDNCYCWQSYNYFAQTESDVTQAFRDCCGSFVGSSVRKC